MSNMGFFGPSVDPVTAELRLDIEAVLHFVLPAIQADVPPRISTEQGTMVVEALIVLGMHNKRDRVSWLDHESVDPAAGNHGSGEPLCFFTGRYVSKTQLCCLGIGQHQPYVGRMERQPEGVASPAKADSVCSSWIFNIRPLSIWHFGGQTCHLEPRLSGTSRRQSMRGWLKIPSTSNIAGPGSEAVQQRLLAFQHDFRSTFSVVRRLPENTDDAAP